MEQDWKSWMWHCLDATSSFRTAGVKRSDACERLTCKVQCQAVLQRPSGCAGGGCQLCCKALELGSKLTCTQRLCSVQLLLYTAASLVS